MAGTFSVEAAADRVGPEANANFDDAAVTALLEDGLDADDAYVGNWGAMYKLPWRLRDSSGGDLQGPSQNHAPMEPMNATALFTKDRCEVWCPTQNGEAASPLHPEASGLPLTQCEVYKTILGGGFGRRGAGDYVHQVVEIAKVFPGTPIKLQWSREEDQKHGFFHPTTMAKMRGSLDAEGNLTGLHMRISGQSILAGLMPHALVEGADYLQFQGVIKEGLNPSMDDHSICYDIPNILVDHAMRNPPIRPGFWRGVNVNQNTIYGMLSRRNGSCCRSRRAGVSFGADEEPSEERRYSRLPRSRVAGAATTVRPGAGIFALLWQLCRRMC